MASDQPGSNQFGDPRAGDHQETGGLASGEATAEQKPSTLWSVYIRLCVMMFLQYLVQGCYLPIVSVYLRDALGFSELAIGAFGSALAVGPLLVPFGLGQLVDRFWPTQLVLAICHLSGGVVMLALFTQTQFWPVVILGTLYSILYVPSMMLTNSLAFAHLKNREGEFPIVRLFGTIGFVAAAFLVESVGIPVLTAMGQDAVSAQGVAFFFAGAIGIVMGFYSLTLPHTPPQASEERKFAPGVVVSMMRYRYFAVLIVTTFFVGIVHKFYFVWNTPFLRDMWHRGGIKGTWEQRVSSIGQVSEVVVMAMLGYMIARLGFKMTFLLGILAYFARCLVLAASISLDIPFGAAMAMACFGQALHGFCFACFLATAFMFVDRVSTPDIRGSMQNLYGTLVFGLGLFAGGFAAGSVGDVFTTEVSAPTIRASLGVESSSGMIKFVDKGDVAKVRDWPGIWLTCAVLAAACWIAFALLFPRSVPAAEGDDEPEP